MIRAALIAAVLMLLAFPATSQAITDQQVTQALQASPCYGQPITVLWDAGLEARGIGAHASGAHYEGDTLEGRIVTNRCEITRNPVDWARLSWAERCEEDMHEILHLAGVKHEPSGVMAPTPEDRWYAPCRTVRERARRDIERLVPAGAQVACGKWSGRAFSCYVDWADAKGRAHARRFRVRTRGDAYAISRLRGAR